MASSSGSSVGDTYLCASRVPDPATGPPSASGGSSLCGYLRFWAGGSPGSLSAQSQDDGIHQRAVSWPVAAERGRPLTNGTDGLDNVPSALQQAVDAAVSAFGATVSPRLSSKAGEPEDQMRGPLETLMTTVAEAVGVKFTAVGESSLADLKVRPDYAVMVNGAISGYIEVKAPGKGASPTRWGITTHDRVQWEKLKALPNVLYTDGQSWGLYRTGERVGEVVKLQGDIRSAGAGLVTADAGLARLLTEFLGWSPVPPRSVGQLVRVVAPLTRLLRDEVTDTLRREQVAGEGPFTNLAHDWRALLFPEADDSEFADGYAQSITFALLLARTENVSFTGKSVDGIARELGKTHSLLGKALAVLTDETIGALSVTLGTLLRVVAVVDFARFAHHVADPYLALYEHFLAEYDPELRKQTGSYYTPAAVVTAMTRLTDIVLRTRLGRSQGLANDGVTIVDPAMGTGPYVLDVLESVAQTVESLEGPGAVPARLRETAERLVGIEKQTGPFAVAEMRVAGVLQRHGAKPPRDGVRLYVADTLDDPFAEQARLAATMEPIAVSRRRANRMKAHEPVVVVLGNPPYREHAKGHGGFIEEGAPNTPWTAPPLAAFRQTGNGQAEYVLSNLYVYFWRWATWKVFDAHPEASDGVICFITTAGYLRGRGFAGMRRYLREHASEGWVIDCTPEGHQPDVATRIFGGVQQPVAIGVFVRRADTDNKVPALIHYRAVHGRQSEKFELLKTMNLEETEWEVCSAEWTAPFVPASGDDWNTSPSLGDLLPWANQGVVGGRTWVYAPQKETLQARYLALAHAADADKARLFLPSRDATLTKKKPGLQGFPHKDVSIAQEAGPGLDPVPIAYRTFDVQYVIPDDRLLSTPRTDLWRVRGPHQIYITEQHDQPGKTGPALSFAAHTPEMHHYNGRGGRVLPLFASSDRSQPNFAPGLLPRLAEQLGTDIEPEDLLAYIAAVTAHPAFTRLFAEDLRTPGIRVPLTADTAVWADALTVGRRVLWLHTRGLRCVGASQGRPEGAPQVTDPLRRPVVAVAIPDTPEAMPDALSYNVTDSTLSVGSGRITPVPAAAVAYEVSGMNVLKKWFGYRKATRPVTRGGQSELDDLRPEAWPSAYTSDLLALLQVLVLVTDLEPMQEELLMRVMGSSRITVGDLTEAAVFPVADSARSPLPKAERHHHHAAQLPLQ